jgi:hypothetical protein
MSEKGDGSNGSDTPGNGVVPKLTVGQRVLASLPNLQRQPPAPKDTPTPRSAGKGGTGGGRSNGGDDSAGSVVSPDEVLAPGVDPTPSRGKFRDALLKPPAPRQPRGSSSGMTAPELTQIIKKIDDREQVLSYGTAVLGVVVGTILTIAAVHLNPPVHAKNHASTGFIVFEGAARWLLSAIVIVAAWKRRRSFVAFALLFLGTSMGFPFALPFWALGIYLIFRVLKWQKELAALTGSAGRTRPEPLAARGRDAAEARRQARNDRMSGRSPGGRRGKKQPEPTGPPPNKRYTPPKPTRQRPSAP